MNAVLEFLAGQDSILSSALVGGFFGLIGGLIGAILFKLKPKLLPNRKIIYPAITVLFAVMGGAIVNPAIKNIKLTEGLIREYKVFKVIFEVYPEEKQNLKKVMSDYGSKKESYEAVQEFGITLTTKYFLPNLVQAPDSLINEYIANSEQILYAIQNKPTACFEYFTGNNSPDTVELLPKDLIQKELDIKGSIIEAGLANEEQVSLLNMQDAMNKIYARYQEYGYDSNEIRTLFGGNNLTPREGCEIAIRFTHTLSSMQDEGAQALKTLVYYQLNPDVK